MASLPGNIRVLNRAEMKAAEAAADAAGTRYVQLMENAGRAAAREMEKWLAGPGRILLLCGSGNNAGDAFVAGRMLAKKGHEIVYIDVTRRGAAGYSPLAAKNLARLPGGVRQIALEEAGWAAEMVVDAVFGTGFHGVLDENVRGVFRQANGCNGLRVALDIPSGLNCDTGEASPDTFRAHHTLSFGAYKPALLMAAATPYVGQVQCLDIGLFSGFSPL